MSDHADILTQGGYTVARIVIANVKDINILQDKFTTDISVHHENFSLNDYTEILQEINLNNPKQFGTRKT